MPVDLGWAQLDLLPAAPYSVHAASPFWTVGVALERQRGVHAVDGQPRHDFDAWPGQLALTAPGVAMFSESPQGGEYLWLQLCEPPDGATPPGALPRRVITSPRVSLRHALALRRWLLQAAPPDALEAAAAQWVGQAWGLWRPHQTPAAPPLRWPWGADLLDFIDAHLDEALTLNTLAARVGLPALAFLRRFTQCWGTTPHAYVLERRLQKARRLLTGTQDSVAEVAAACGFAQQSHLGQAFKRMTGLTPQAYRRLQAGRSVFLPTIPP